MALKFYLKGATLILVFPPVQLLVFPAAIEGLVASCTALIGLKDLLSKSFSYDHLQALLLFSCSIACYSVKRPARPENWIGTGWITDDLLHCFLRRKDQNKVLQEIGEMIKRRIR